MLTCLVKNVMGTFTVGCQGVLDLGGSSAGVSNSTFLLRSRQPPKRSRKEMEMEDLMYSGDLNSELLIVHY